MAWLSGCAQKLVQKDPQTETAAYCCKPHKPCKHHMFEKLLSAAKEALCKEADTLGGTVHVSADRLREASSCTCSLY